MVKMLLCVKWYKVMKIPTDALDHETHQDFRIKIQGKNISSTSGSQIHKHILKNKWQYCMQLRIVRCKRILHSVLQETKCDSWSAVYGNFHRPVSNHHFNTCKDTTDLQRQLQLTTTTAMGTTILPKTVSRQIRWEGAHKDHKTVQFVQRFEICQQLLQFILFMYSM